MRRPYKAKSLLIALVGLAVVALVSIALATWSRPAAQPTGQAGVPATTLTAAGVSARWVMAENAKPGSASWQITDSPTSGHIEGFADHVYARAGQRVSLYVSSDNPRFHVEAYRVGYYQGIGARLVWRSADTNAVRQPPCPVAAATNTVACDNWAPSIGFPITDAFVPGDYLLKLIGGGGAQSYVPLTVWDPHSHAAYLVKNDVFTWQAWNPYGGYDFYAGQGTCPPGGYPLCSRARIVSYDRPYGDEQGTGDFLWLEAPLVRLMERDGLDVSYATDLTIVDHPEILRDHKALLSLGHDECWSLTERQAVTAAQRTGLNVAFFGASGMLRHVRPQPSPLGPQREVVDYRDLSADPLNGKGNPLDVTGNTWSSPPANWPESPFVGEAYNGFLEPDVRAALTVTDAGAWIFAGTGLTNGSTLPAVLGSDVDSLEPGQQHPANVAVLAHSTLPAAQAQPASKAGSVFYSDMTYYTDPNGKGGVWDSGTNNWIPALDSGGGESAATAASVQRITENLLWLFGQAPAGTIRPSVPNIQQIYPNS